MLVLNLVSPLLQCLTVKVSFCMTLKKESPHKSLVTQLVDLSGAIM